MSATPMIGYGTGSVGGLFERAATNHEPPDRVVANRHSLMLNVAVQWGLVGIVLVYAMWVYLVLFRGEGLVAWVRLLVVVQSISTSQFNAHIFDFHKLWIYVLGVGVGGGVMLAAKRRDLSAPAKPR